MTLDEARAAGRGTRVVYSPGYGNKQEHGRITSVGRIYVFVRYTDQPANADARATAPEFLRFVTQRQEQM